MVDTLHPYSRSLLSSDWSSGIALEQAVGISPDPFPSPRQRLLPKKEGRGEDLFCLKFLPQIQNRLFRVTLHM